MSNWVKYGAYFVSVGLSITGVWFWQRPTDARVIGEDVAELYEAVMEWNVVAYLQGDEQPDYYKYYWLTLADSNSVGDHIKYEDISQIAGFTRLTMLQDDGFANYTTARAYWITNGITADTFEPSIMAGDYNTTLSTNEYGVLTESYTYATNTVKDALVTTATKAIQPARGAVYTRYNDESFPSLTTATNYPVSASVFPGNTANGIENVSSYYWWLFSEPYLYPWEQWSWRNSSKVTIANESSENIAWTNICYIGTNKFDLSFGASKIDTNKAGYSIGSFYDYHGHRSVKFAYVTPYNDGNGLSINFTYPTETPPVITNNIQYSWQWYRQYYLTRSWAIANEPTKIEVVYGDKLYLRSYDYNSIESIITFADFDFDAGGQVPQHKTNFLSIVKVSVPSRPLVSPIYFAVSVRDGTPIKTNSYFTLSNDIATSENPTGTATTNALVPAIYGDSAYTTDDMRISTNKLYGLMAVLTNLNRTVYFEDVGALVSTNCIITEYTTNNNAILSTNYTGTSLPIQYFDFGDGSGYIADFLSSATVHSVTTNTGNAGEVFNENLHFEAQSAGSYNENEGNPYWSSSSAIDGSYSKKEYEHKGVILNYPSAYAVTNGYVDAVTVYALYENVINSQTPYRGKESDTNVTFDVSGDYWTHENMGTAIAGATINIPTSALPETRSVGTNRIYGTYDDGYALRNKAVYQKIYSVTNPTEIICFDIPKPTVTGIDFATKNAYSYDKGIDPDLYYENLAYEYDIDYSIRMVKFMIVVDWHFKHLGGGFTPQTNNPAWRQ